MSIPWSVLEANFRIVIFAAVKFTALNGDVILLDWFEPPLLDVCAELHNARPSFVVKVVLKLLFHHTSESAAILRRMLRPNISGSCFATRNWSVRTHLY